MIEKIKNIARNIYIYIYSDKAFSHLLIKEGGIIYLFHFLVLGGGAYE